MITSNKIQKALEFTFKVHQIDQKQSRKGKQIPYIFHPLAVANILDKVDATEDQIVAGILHDTIEDSTPEHKVTKEELEKKKGLNNRAAMKHDSLLVKSADVLHNLTDQIADYQFQGEKMWKYYNASKSAQLRMYQKMVAALKKAWPPNPLLNNLERQVKFAKKLWSK